MKQRIIATLALGAGLASVALAPAAHATSYDVQVSTDATNGTPFNAVMGAEPLNGAGPGAPFVTAEFTYTGPLSFDTEGPSDLNGAFGFSTSNISSYNPSSQATFSYGGTQVADFSTVDSFLNSSASDGGYGYGSLYQIVLGQLSAGTVLTVTHDDGYSLYENQTAIDTANSAPTTAETNTDVIASTGNYVLYYARENGAPSVLDVAVPEPASLALLGSFLLGFGLITRRKRS